jgi:hypothetical protein
MARKGRLITSLVLAGPLSLLGGCVSLGTMMERSASLSKAPDPQCMQTVISRAAAPGIVTHNHNEQKNWVNGRVKNSTDSYRVPLGGLNAFTALQAGAGFTVVLVHTYDWLQKLGGSAENYRVVWFYGPHNAGQADEVRRISQNIEADMVKSCGAIFSSSIREHIQEQSTFSLNTI